MQGVAGETGRSTAISEGHAMRRRQFLQKIAGSCVVYALAPALPALADDTMEEHLERAHHILLQTPSLDLHTHPGMFALKNIPNSVNPRKYFGDAKVAQRVAEMKSGKLGCGFIATVSDAPILRPPRKAGESFEGRSWKSGEAWSEYQRQKVLLDELVEEHGLQKAMTAADIRAAHRAGKVAVVYDCEGGDHLEQKPERLELLHNDGVRVLQLVHVANNGLADVANSPGRYHGLSATGQLIIREMNRLHMLIDMAHASEEATIQAAELSTQPIISSHSLLEWRDNPGRSLMTQRHARAVIETGGIIGAFPGAVNGTFAMFIENILRLVEFVGIDHVGIGSDMDGNINPVIDDYNALPKIAAHLLAHGLNDAEVGKVMGGNGLRVLEAVTG